MMLFNLKKILNNTNQINHLKNHNPKRELDLKEIIVKTFKTKILREA